LERSDLTINLFQQLAQVLQKEKAVLATVIAIKGSVPRKVGAKMIIAAYGSTFNTIGGSRRSQSYLPS
jgi:xanthine dehydrogenase accessory factor